MNTFIEKAKWRYATKKFDSTRKVSEIDLEILLEAIRLSASSYGLQPYKVLIIENKELRKKLQPAAWGQAQIVDASHVIVFANLINFGEQEIDNYIESIAETRGIIPENLKGYGDFMKMKLLPLSEEEKNIWTSKQTYIAMTNLMNAAAELQIDVTPMEGFETEKVNELLGLNKIGLNTSLIATIGYRHPEDTTQHNKKVRKSKEELFIHIK